MKLRTMGMLTALCLHAWGCASDEEPTETETDAPEAGTPTDTDAVEAGASDTESENDTESDGEPPDAGGPETDASAEDPTDGGTIFDPNAGEGGVDLEEPDAGEPGPTFSISGQLKIGSTLFVDGDTRNIDNPAIRNDRRADAQQISSPSTVGGYIGPIPVVDAAGDPTGDFTADDIDVYSVTLAAGQTVTLFTAEAPEADTPLADLDLFLYASDGSLIESSEGIGDKEQVLAPTTATYFIAIERYQDPDDDSVPEDGQALYSLAVGIAQPGALQASINQQRLSSLWPAVAGEAVVKLGFGPQSAELARTIAPRYAPDATGYQLVELPLAKRFDPQSTAAAKSTVAAIKRLRRTSGVVSATPNYIYQTLQTAPVPVNDPLYPSQWHYEQIDLAAAWANSDQIPGAARGAGVVVAVLDTGIALSHPDWVNTDGSSQLTTDGYDMISDPEVAADGDGRDSNADDPGDARTPGDSSFHGTHCAGTVAAATNNGVGAAGVAPNARIMPIRVLGRGGGTMEDIRQGILYAAGLSNASGQLPTRRADIISMSLGGPGVSDAMAEAVASANAQGSIVIAAAGNSNAAADFFSPAGAPGVITVSATDFNREKAFYSNYGLARGVIDVAAPGGDTGADANLDGQPDGVISLVYKNNGATKYAAYQGTSMACPHVSGVAALMKAIWPEMGPEEFRQALASISVDIGEAGEDLTYGHGLINANLAVAYAIERSGTQIDVEPVLSLSTSVLDFGGALDSMLLAVGNTGKGTLSITSVSASEPWVLFDAGGLVEGTNTISIQRSALPEGVSTATITVESNGGTQLVSLRAYQGEEPTGGNVGVVYVLVVDPVTGEQRGQTATALEEEYYFELTDIPAGRYYLVAGTDLRDTFFLGNDGDAYGAFPLAQDPQLLCRFVEGSAAQGCPELTEAELEDPNLSDVTIPIQYLLDVGAEQEEADSAFLPNATFSPAATLTKRPNLVRRAW